MFDTRHEQPMRAAGTFAKTIVRTAEALVRQSCYRDLADAITGGTLMTDRFDPLETSALISSGYRRYLRSLLPVRDPRIATALRAEVQAEAGRLRASNQS